MQRSRHPKETSEIRDLGLQSLIQFRYKLVKWFYHHAQMILLSLALPHPHYTTINQHRRVYDPTPSVNTLCILRLYRQVSLLIAEHIGIKTWLQANNWRLYG